MRMTQETKGKRHNQMTAQELLVVSETATKKSETEKVVNEFARRKQNALERKISKSGKPLSEEFMTSKVKKISDNLATAQKYMNTFTTDHIQIRENLEVAPASTFVGNPLGISKGEITRVMNILAKLKA